MTMLMMATMAMVMMMMMKMMMITMMMLVRNVSRRLRPDNLSIWRLELKWGLESCQPSTLVAGSECFFVLHKKLSFLIVRYRWKAASASPEIEGIVGRNFIEKKFAIWMSELVENHFIKTQEWAFWKFTNISAGIES